MAYGSNSNQLTPSVSGFAFFNKDSTIDKTMMSFNMWKSTIRLSIYPLIESETDDQIKYDKKGGITIYLIPYKAYMFAQLLKEFKTNPDGVCGKGIPSGMCLITIEDPSIMKGYKDPNANPLIVIRKVNQESGNVECSYAYELNSEFYMVVEKYDQDTGSFTKNTDHFKMVELDMIIMQLENYANAMTNAIAFSVVDNMYPFMDKIANKLGVELLGSSYGSSFKNTSYFGSNSNQSNNTSVMNNTSLDQMI